MSYRGNLPFDGLKKVGFWFSDDAVNRNYPKARSMVDLTWDPRERSAVLEYVKNGRQGESYRGWSNCRICGKSNGSSEQTDGVYVWPSGFAHYIEAHGVKPPTEFVQHVLRQGVR